MYSKIFQLNGETFYNYKDRWKIDIKNYLYYGKTYTKQEIDKILNNFAVGMLANRKNMAVQLRITFYMFSKTNRIVDSWGKGRQPPEIYLVCNYGKNKAITHQISITLYNPEAFRFKLIRTLTKGNGKIYTEVGLIKLPAVEIKSNIVDSEKLSNIDDWYEQIISSFNCEKKKT